uniref:CCHC-type domain-containing protein n=1 Tax=Labrus bergylta TaxID=56723 RepID=A0A3Q3G7S6_9LABR
MTHVHYKFFSKLSYNTVVHDGPNITLQDLKRQIMDMEKLRVGYCDLQITNAQTKQDEEGAIPKGSSVIVRRIPIVGVKSGMNRRIGPQIGPIILQCETPEENGRCEFGRTKHSFLIPLNPFYLNMYNIYNIYLFAFCPAFLKNVLPSFLCLCSYSNKFGNPLPLNYVCYRCGNTGHHIKNCPNSKVSATSTPVKIKKSTGIPRSLMVEVDDPSMKGAMLTNSGRYAIPAIDA